MGWAQLKQEDPIEAILKHLRHYYYCDLLYIVLLEWDCIRSVRWVEMPFHLSNMILGRREKTVITKYLIANKHMFKVFTFLFI